MDRPRRRPSSTPTRKVVIRRSGKAWLVRVVLALAVALGGILAVRYSFAQVLVRSDPAAAFRLAPGDGLIAARSAAVDYVEASDVRARSAVVARARAALRLEPTAVQAVTTLGLESSSLQDIARSRQLFGYSQKLSRRDLVTQLWAIEDAVGRQDVRDVVHHYDIALRTSKTAPDVLFPVLAAALVDPAVRMHVLYTLRARPVWMLNFVNFVSLTDAEPEAAAQLFIGLTRAGVPVPSAATTAVINRLVTADAVDAAWRYYATIRSQTSRDHSRDPQFAAELDAPSIFDWMPVDGPGISSSIQRNGKRGLFDFSVAPSVSGTLLQQTQMLSAGKYHLSGRATGIVGDSQSLPYWVLTCRDGRELGRVGVPVSGENGKDFAGDFEVPSACQVQTLSLIAQPSNAIAGISGQIVSVSLKAL